MHYKATYFKLSENYEVTVNGTLNHTALRIEELKKAIDMKKSTINPNQSVYGVDNPKNELKELEIKLSECTEQRFSKKDEENINSHLVENSKDGWRILKIEAITKGVYYERNKIGYNYNAQEGFVIFWERE